MKNNRIKLLVGKIRLTNEEMKKFNKGDSIWGNDRMPEELKSWDINQREEAEKALHRHKCSYERYNEHLTDVTEYALEYFEADDAGEFLQGSDYELAE